MTENVFINIKFYLNLCGYLHIISWLALRSIKLEFKKNLTHQLALSISEVYFQVILLHLNTLNAQKNPYFLI